MREDKLSLGVGNELMREDGGLMVIARKTCICLPLILLAITVLGLPIRAQTRRAVLVGINNYVPENSTTSPGGTGMPSGTGAGAVASRVQKANAGRGSWSNLDGSLNDIASIRQLLITRFGFQDADVHVLTEAQATREGIRTAIRTYLANAASAGDISFFYYAGHGSQMRNSKSSEDDKLDETIVPSDSFAGALDVRDKELARDFMEVIRKGAVLTAIFDSCHSGSIARGLSRWGKLRDLPADHAHDAADDYNGPFPEKEGGLIFSAAQDTEPAAEGKDDQGTDHGAFTAALIHVLATVPPNESANAIFRRTLAVMGSMDANQVPVIAGTPERLQEGLFGSASTNISGKLILPLMKIFAEGRVEVLGGFALGLGIGSQIVFSESSVAKKVRVEITDQTLSTSTGKILEGDAGSLKAGGVFTVDKWVPANQSALKLWVPPLNLTKEAIRDAADQVEKARSSDSPKIVDDPSETSLTHFISWTGQDWVVQNLKTGKTTSLGKSFQLSDWIKKSGLDQGIIFISLPLPTGAKDFISNLGARSFPARLVNNVQEADYALIGRSREGAIDYTWLRPGTISVANLATGHGRGEHALHAGDVIPSSLPSRSRWISTDPSFSSLAKTTQELETLAGTLSRINSWLNLSPPPGESNFPYHLVVTEADSSDQPDGRQIAIGDGRWYGLALKANPSDLKHEVSRRKVYVFVIDSEGNATPLYPSIEMGDVENIFPTAADTRDGGPPTTKQLGPPKLFQISEPFGTDTYVLLTLSPKDSIDLESLRWTGVGGGSKRGSGGMFDALFASVGTRGAKPATPSSWSLEKVEIVSKSKLGTKP
jgi:Caspase domain